MAILAALAVAGSAHAQDDGPPNVVLMMADDLGWGDTGYHGHPVLKTPHLDALAAGGLRLERFYAAAPVCSPTRGSCLTGRHPFRYGVFSANVGHMKPQEQTLAELLQARGYRTGHFGKWHLGTLTKTEKDSNRGGPRGAAHFAPPAEHGFEVNFSTEAKAPTWDPLLRPRGNNSRKFWSPVADEADAVPYGTAYWSQGRRVTENTRGDDSRVIMDRVLPFVEQSVEQGRPFLAVVWFHAPHLPVVAGPQYEQMYAGHSDYERHYWGCITAMDEQIGRLMAELQRLGVARNTLVCFNSDNGPEGRAGQAPGSAGPLRGRKRDLLEGGIRVPGIIHWPAVVKPGRQTSTPACTSDYLPTILAACGAELPERHPHDGVSLLPLLRGEMTARPRPIAFQTRRTQALIDNRFKLLAARNAGGRWQDQLFDLPADQAEQQDLAQQHPDLAARMRDTLDRWLRSCEKSLAGGDYE